VIELDTGGEDARPRLAVSVMGLTGPSGVLPRYFTEAVNASLRERSRSMHAFLDLLSHRLVAHFAQAGAKYRPHRIAETVALARKPPGSDGLTSALLALTGFGTPGLAERVETGTAPILHFAGIFAARPRSVSRLQALASDWLGRAVEVQQFVGTWLPIPQDQRTRLGGAGGAGQFARLGREATLGSRAWDVQAFVVLRVGPLDRGSFAALLPDGPTLARFISLVQAYLGLETGFAVNPVLAASDVPETRLTTDGEWRPRLGWNTWLAAPDVVREADGEEAVFAARSGNR
jgi:type VI secretion system protein ImpH